MKRLISLATSVCLASPAVGQIEVQFQDGNPWDTFAITNTGCAIIQAKLDIDLSTSLAGVLIDTEYGGPGTKDPMPAELARGKATLSPVTDGDQHIHLAIRKLDSGTPIQVRLDVDDTAGSRYAPKVEVYGDEITGATVTLDYAGQKTHGTFNAAGRATVALPENTPDCALVS